MTRFACVRVLFALLITALVLGLPSTGAAQTPPPGLAGEELLSTSVDLDGPCSNLTFSTSGTATGPYTGVFQESGTISVASGGQITALTTQFSIDSSTGLITGTKSFAPTSSTGASFCSSSAFNPTVLDITANNLQYSATIRTPDGQTCTTTGAALLRISGDSQGIRE